MYSTREVDALQKVFEIIITAYYNVLLGGEINEAALNRAKIEYDKIKNPVLPFEHLLYLHDKMNVGASTFRANFNKIVKNFMEQQESNRKISASDVEIEEDFLPNLQGYIDYYDHGQCIEDFTPVIPAPSDLFTSSHYASVTPDLDAESFPRSHIIDILKGEYQVNMFPMMTSATKKMDIKPIVTIISPNIVALSRGVGEAFATGILIHPLFVLTARHSLEEQDIREIAIKANFQKNEAGIMHFGDLTYCSKIIEDNKLYDYAIIQLVKKVDFDDRVTFKTHIPNSKVLFFHHPGGGPKKVSCQEVAADSRCEALTLNGYHDTIKGSSGGVYVDAEGNVVAIHSLGKQRTVEGQIADSSYTTTGTKIQNIFLSSAFLRTLYSQNGQFYSFDKRNIFLEVPIGTYYLDVDLTRISTAQIEAVIKGKPVDYPGVSEHRPSSLASIDWTYHHIIPKGNMEFMWIMGREYSPLNTKLETIAWQQNKQYSNGALTANSIIWTNWNLFIGPESSLRYDDPASLKEPNKPGTFPQELWDKITEINTQIEQCFLSRYTISAVAKDAIINSYTERSQHETKKGIKYNKTPKYDSTKAPQVAVSTTVTYKTKLDELCTKLAEIETLTFTAVTQVFRLTSASINSVSTILAGPWFHKTTNSDWTLHSSGKYLLKLPGSPDVSVSNVMEVTPPPLPSITVAFAHIHYDNNFLNNPLSEKIIRFAYHAGGSKAINEVVELGFESQYSQKYLETNLITSKTSGSYTSVDTMLSSRNTNNAIISSAAATLIKAIEVKESIIYICREIVPIFDKSLPTERSSFLAKEGLWTMLHLVGGLTFAFTLPGSETFSVINKFLVPLLSTSAYVMRHYYFEFEHNALGSEYSNFLCNIILDAGFGALNAVPMAIITVDPSLVISGALHGIMMSSFSYFENSNEISWSGYNMGNIASAIIIYNRPSLNNIQSFSNVILAINQVGNTLIEVALTHKLVSKLTDQIINNFYHYCSSIDYVVSDYEQYTSIEVIGNLSYEFEQQE